MEEEREIYTLSSRGRRNAEGKNKMKFSAVSEMPHCAPVSEHVTRVCKPKMECMDIHERSETFATPCGEDYHHHGHGYSSIGWAVLWFIIIAVIVWLIIFSLKPAWALNEDGEIDTGKVLLASIVIALIIVIIIWIIWAACRGGWGYGGY